MPGGGTPVRKTVRHAEALTTGSPATPVPLDDALDNGLDASEEEGVLGTIPRILEAAPAASDSPRHLRRRVSGKRARRPVASSAQAGLPEDWTRSTVIARVTYVAQLRALAYLDRRAIKDVLDEALGAYLQRRAPDVSAAEALYQRRTRV